MPPRQRPHTRCRSVAGAARIAYGPALHLWVQNTTGQRQSGPRDDSLYELARHVVLVAAVAFGCSLDRREFVSNAPLTDAGPFLGVNNPSRVPGTADASQSPDVNQSDTPANSGSTSEQTSPDALCGVDECLASEGDAGTLSCPGCNIEGGCFTIGEVNPDNRCERCDPSRNPAGWSANDGGTCDDGLFCTVDDVCVAGLCSGAERLCDDGIACNGVSVCVEADAACSSDVSQCGTLEVCNLESGQCESTCNGCVVEGVCFTPGASSAGNPCFVCDPNSSITTLTVAPGRNCGSGATECSGQDTCNAAGQCVPNHLAAGAPCGFAGGAQCDAADTCDGSGACVLRVAQDGSPCDDGQFCTSGDRCLAGQCAAGGPRNCGVSQSWDEVADQCLCTGCSIGGTCFAGGALNPANACQVCSPSQNLSAFVNNNVAGCVGGRTARELGQTCGAPTEQCVQGTCSAGRCCEPLCNDGCQADGSCDCGELLFREGACRLPDTERCTQDDECFSGVCPEWFSDFDLDGFGSTDLILRTCGLEVPRGGPVSGASFVLNADDCCDNDPDAQTCEECGL